VNLGGHGGQFAFIATLVARGICQGVCVKAFGLSYETVGYAEYMVVLARRWRVSLKRVLFERRVLLMCAGITTFNSLRRSGSQPGRHGGDSTVRGRKREEEGVSACLCQFGLAFCPTLGFPNYSDNLGRAMKPSLVNCGCRTITRQHECSAV